VITLAPALVTVEAPNTANTPAVPRLGAVKVFTCVEPGDPPRFSEPGLVGSLLDELHPAVVARATASDSAAKLRIPFFMKDILLEQ
jgi:hypothetical protein